MSGSIRIKPEMYLDWVSTPVAQRLLALEAGWLREWTSQLHGHNLLYAGIDNQPRFLRHGRTQHAFNMALQWQRQDVEAAGIMNDDAWPFADNTLDVVVLQHGLDMSGRPHQIIREAARSIVPSGYLIVTGFNPYSLWGGVCWLRTFSTRMPWITNPVSERRLRDWLTLLDFRIEHSNPIAHTWPLTLGSEKLSRRTDRVLAGVRWLPASGYILIARKTIAGMTPIRPRRWVLSEPAFGMTQPLAGRSELPADEREKLHVG